MEKSTKYPEWVNELVNDVCERPNTCAFSYAVERDEGADHERHCIRVWPKDRKDGEEFDLDEVEEVFPGGLESRRVNVFSSSLMGVELVGEDADGRTVALEILNRKP